MPRSKPKEVIEHRVTLGDFERKQIKEAMTAKLIKDIGTGVGIASIGIGGTYCAYKIGKAIYDWGEDAVDWLKTEADKLNPIPVFTGERMPKTNADGKTPVEMRDDGWIFGGPPSPIQVIWENTFG